MATEQIVRSVITRQSNSKSVEVNESSLTQKRVGRPRQVSKALQPDDELEPTVKTKPVEGLQSKGPIKFARRK